MRQDFNNRQMQADEGELSAPGRREKNGFSIAARAVGSSVK